MEIDTSKPVSNIADDLDPTTPIENLSEKIAQYIILDKFVRFENGKEYIDIDLNDAITDKEKVIVFQTLAMKFLNEMEEAVESRDGITIYENRGEGHQLKTVPLIKDRIDDDKITKSEISNWADIAEATTNNISFNDALSKNTSADAFYEMIDSGRQLSAKDRVKVTTEYEDNASAYEKSLNLNIATENIKSAIPEAFQDYWIDHFDTNYPIEDFSKLIAHSMLEHFNKLEVPYYDIAKA